MAEIVIDDFSPGIRQIPSPNHPPGTATDTNTVGCRASEGGMLVALPKMTSEITAASALEFRGAGALASSEYRISGLFSHDPVTTLAGGTTQTTGVNQNNSELWVGLECYTDAGSSQHRRRVARYHRSRTAPTWEIVWSNDATAAYSATSRPAVCYFDQTGSNSAAPTTPGGVPIVFLFTDTHLRMTPADTTLTTTSTAALPAPAATSLAYMMCHQNRAVVWVFTVLGANAGVGRLHSDTLYWTEVNDLTSLDTALGGSYTNVLAYIEETHGVEFACRMTSDQLFVMKRNGGALVLQGDLNNYTAIPKVAVTSSGYSLCPGVFSPLGICYPVNANGVYVWEGGDTSRNISTWMEPDFWRPTPSSPANTASRTADGWGHSHVGMTTWQQFILLPNNYLFDADYGGWWRLYETSVPDGESTKFTDIRRWTHDWSGRWAWGAPSGYTAEGDAVLYEFDMLQPREDWSWQSHPMPTTLTRTVSVNEVWLWVDAQNTASTLTVTVSTAENTVGQTQTVTVDVADRVQAVRFPTKWKVNGTGVQVRVVADSNASNVEAPRLHKIVLDFDEAHHKVAR